MESKPNIIKRIEPLECPHCKQPILISMHSMIPHITKLSKLEEVKAAKMELLERLEAIQFATEEDKEEILRWIKDDETVIDSDDVDAIEKNVAVQQSEKISKMSNQDNNQDEQ